jgi:hypothetical protein
LCVSASTVNNTWCSRWDGEVEEWVLVEIAEVRYRRTMTRRRQMASAKRRAGRKDGITIRSRCDTGKTQNDIRRVDKKR